MAKKNSSRFLLLITLVLAFFGCSEEPSSQEKVDAIYYNGNIYTVDSAFSRAQAFVIKDGKFLAIGNDEDILANYTSDSIFDLNSKPVYPGFYDAHCHFVGYAKSLGQVNLVGTSSFEEVIDKVRAFRKEFPNQPWIEGRGWDQNDWEIKEFPTNDTLNILFPETPVLLRRIDGHGALANAKALEIAGIDLNTTIDGGIIEQKDGTLTGILVDNAVDLVRQHIPEPSRETLTKLLLKAEKNCLNVGLTTVDDAGLPLAEIMLLDSLQKAGLLNIEVYAMLNPEPEEFNFAGENGFYQTNKLNVRSFKVYADGALGSRGACLKEEYSDKPGHKGFLLSSRDSLTAIASKIHALGFQMNTHCIGDSANKTLLNIYQRFLEQGNDSRWRIEHAQVVDKKDIGLFKAYNIIPSVQPTHCTSDMYWAKDRLGPDRIENAYAYQSLLKQHGKIAAGSDFPIESINPLFGFYAAVSRKDQKGYPEDGYYSDEAISRKDALKAMTIWAAYSNFEENNKGSIEKGKKANFVVLQKDIMTIPEGEIWKTKVLKTCIP